jgi:hypothetical protein
VAPGGPAGGGPDPCSLLTEGEVGAVAGAEVSRVEGPGGFMMGSQCEWYFPHPTLGEEQVTVNVWVGLEFYAPEGPTAEMTGFEPVAGIGDAAHLWPRVPDLCTVIFRRGEIVVQVTAAGLGGDDACLDLSRA